MDMRTQANIMTDQELDLGSLMMTMHNGDETVARGRHKPAKRQTVSSYFMHNGYSIYMDIFGFLHGIGKSRIKAHYWECGMEPRVHKNTKRLPIYRSQCHTVAWKNSRLQ